MAANAHHAVKLSDSMVQLCIPRWCLHRFYIPNSSAEPGKSMTQRSAHTAKWGWKRHWF